jgi:spore coat protein U-like protein
MKPHRWIAALLPCALMLGGAEGTLLAPAAQAAECSLAPAQLAFGPVDTLSATEGSAVASLTISCDQIAEGVEAVTVCAHLGAGTGGSDGAARLLGGPGDMRYGLYRDVGHGEALGHQNAPALGEPARFVLGVADGQASGALTVYGMVPGGQQTLPPGSYASLLSDLDAVFYFDEGEALDCSGEQSAQASLSVSAEVLANCLIQTGNLNFGVIGLLDRNVDAIGDVLVACTPETGYAVTIGDGLWGTGTAGQRRMRSDSNYLAYELYQDTGRVTPWTEASPLVGEGQGEEETYSVYGRIPPQNAAVGSYSDTVVVTITYDQ